MQVSGHVEYIPSQEKRNDDRISGYLYDYRHHPNTIYSS